MAKAGLLYVGTDDGVVLFSEPGAAGRWLRVGHELRGEAVRSIWTYAESPLVVLAAAGNTLWRSDDGGRVWAAALEGVAGFGIASGRIAPATVYLATPGSAVRRSDDAGLNWKIAGNGAWAAPGEVHVIVAPDNARRVYLASGDGVWWSTDAGISWARYGEGLTSPVVDLAVVAGGPGRLYALVEDILYCCDGPENPWLEVRTAPASNGQMAVLPGKEPALLLGLANGGIARSADQGAIWADSQIQGLDRPMTTALIPSGYHMDTAFAGVTDTLLMSTDRGRAWQILKTGLPPIRSMIAARLD